MTAWKGVEDVVELIIQIAYLSVFGADTFVILNLLGTVIMVRGLGSKHTNEQYLRRLSGCYHALPNT